MKIARSYLVSVVCFGLAWEHMLNIQVVVWSGFSFIITFLYSKPFNQSCFLAKLFHWEWSSTSVFHSIRHWAAITSTWCNCPYQYRLSLHDAHSCRFGSGHTWSRSRVRISGTIPPISKVHGERKWSEKVKIPRVIWRQFLLWGQRVIAWAFY